jgi:hypothetical protein
VRQEVAYFAGEQLRWGSTELVRGTQALIPGHQTNNETMFLCAASERAREMIPFNLDVTFHAEDHYNCRK